MTAHSAPRDASAAARPKPIEHSVYIGRERLGRYVRIDRKKYRAFDANDRPLGSFRVRERALAAIRKALRVRKSTGSVAGRKASIVAGAPDCVILAFSNKFLCDEVKSRFGSQAPAVVPGCGSGQATGRGR
jgi:hypothetical protein